MTLCSHDLDFQSFIVQPLVTGKLLKMLLVNAVNKVHEGNMPQISQHPVQHKRQTAVLMIKVATSKKATGNGACVIQDGL